MLSRKYEARDLEKGCWTKRCHGVALREPTRSFSGLVQEADPFIADVAWLKRRIFSSFDTLPSTALASLGKIAHDQFFGRSVDYGNASPIDKYDYTMIPLIAAKTLAKLNHADYAG